MYSQINVLTLKKSIIIFFISKNKTTFAPALVSIARSRVTD
jgi:hypothetical protein